MNDAHLHLVVNHFPIIGTILGLGILIAGLVLKNKSIQNTAFVLFVMAAVFGFFSMYTGEGAEEMVEDFPNIGKAIIHEHEELAEKLALLLYATGIFALISLYMGYKRAGSAKIVSLITLVLAVVSCLVSIKVGTSGGEIRHTEIRENNTEISTVDKSETQNEESKQEKE